MEIINQVEFKGENINVYFDEKNKSNYICWRCRNPESFYQGIIYRNNITGEISYPKDAIIPKQTEKDREIIPKFIIYDSNILENKDKEIILEILDKGFKIRNRIK